LLSNGGCKCGVGLPQVGGSCGRIGVDSCEADANLIVIFDAVVRVDVDVSSALGGFSPNEVGVSVFNQGDTTAIVKPTVVRKLSVDFNEPEWPP
jgi:hypothetical protein